MKTGRVAAAGVIIGTAVAALGRVLYGRWQDARGEYLPGGPLPEPGSPPETTPAQERVRQSITHDCGQELRVAGEGRHRVVWLPDAPMSEPLLDATCPQCGK